MAAGGGVGVREMVARLRDAGLDAVAGDGPDLRESAAEWVEVHRAAHGLGMRTAVTMVFCAGETLEQRVEFMHVVRELQEETGGVAAFLPMAADAPGGRDLDAATAVERLKTLAVARMFLDNVENLQAVRAGHGLKVLQTGLRFGANDLGALAPGVRDASEEDVRRIIRDAGFMPVQRDMGYRAMMLS